MLNCTGLFLPSLQRKNLLLLQQIISVSRKCPVPGVVHRKEPSDGWDQEMNSFHDTPDVKVWLFGLLVDCKRLLGRISLKNLCLASSKNTIWANMKRRHSSALYQEMLQEVEGHYESYRSPFWKLHVDCEMEAEKYRVSISESSVPTPIKTMMQTVINAFARYFLPTIPNPI